MNTKKTSQYEVMHSVNVSPTAVCKTS